MHNHALIYASMMGRLDVVKYLVENGADVTDINNSAVKYAARDGHLDVVKYLVEHGADVTDKNGMSMNVLQLAKYNKYNTQEMFDYLISHGATE
jgi:ankyrin repeat protein